MALRDISVEESEQIPEILGELTAGAVHALLAGGASGAQQQQRQEHEEEEEEEEEDGEGAAALQAALQEATPSVMKLRVRKAGLGGGAALPFAGIYKDRGPQSPRAVCRRGGFTSRDFMRQSHPSVSPRPLAPAQQHALVDRSCAS